MTAAELSRATAKYDKEFVAMDEGKPLTAAQKALHLKAKRRGRPQVGRGAKTIALTVERDLLDKADTFARRHGLKRSEMVAQGLRLLMAS
jgi:hypothetical protein